VKVIRIQRILLLNLIILTGPSVRIKILRGIELKILMIVILKEQVLLV